MLERIIAPGHYRRGPGAIQAAVPEIQALGIRACLVGGHRAQVAAGPALAEALAAAGIEIVAKTWYGGECCPENIAAVAATVKETGADFLVGVGGGKALDTSKGAAWQAGVPLVAVPTIAATCAAFTSIAIIYDREGHFLEISHHSVNPALVLVDSQIIAAAPGRYLAAGMGDTVAKYIELQATSTAAASHLALEGALTLARLCYDSILAAGPEARAAVEDRSVTPALEKVIDAVILISGLVSGLGGDDGRTAGAHGVYEGLTASPLTRGYCHGELVAFGNLVQLVLEGKDAEEIRELAAFNRQVGLPVTLEQVGLSPTDGPSLDLVSQAAADSPDMANMPFPVTAAMVREALLAADRTGREL
ncbi:iron-containing alcohol dehydrogenase family protein [Moorella sp. Hama-1]|uniref:iron-containing alcohol dehydrogenase family protein n=1 Tax=Moorella sp. Hama-1 TaxID=2138101 RepID=UPI000D64565A|nr:iron-containing alcohol dehydrogenase family protein [Moorella sp. Hama-1]MDN5360961.1 glycerol dehydrogenase [Moorella sp. (in: firmicutes)]BCV20276.1 iron-containing alcohol dehydrogenase [Moorella sp. Hama-1]